MSFVQIFCALILGFMLCLAVYYLYLEHSITQWKEFLILLFFPFIGLGLWKYNNAIRTGEVTLMTKSWYIWHYLMITNIILVIILGVAAYLAIKGLDMGLATKQLADAGSGVGMGFGMLLDGLLLLVAILAYVVLAAILIFVPMKVASSIKTKILEKKLHERPN